MSTHILVLEGITDRGLEILKAEGWQVDVRKAMPPEELAAAIPPYDALMIRSSSQITAPVLEAATNLRIIGRPGVGVDNVDLEAATRRGIVVMNSPGGNLVSTTELALGLLLACARNIAQADACMKAGKWDRKSFAGVELGGKRLGVVGFGRIGREVAARCQALGMEVVAYDPFVSATSAERLRVPLLSLDELLQTSDFVMFVSIFTITLLTFAIAGLAIGFGTLYPQFETENAAQIPTSFGGLLFMMAAVGLIGGVVILEARPVYGYLSARTFGTETSPVEMIVGFGLAAALCLTATMLPIRLALRRLETLERG